MGDRLKNEILAHDGIIISEEQKRPQARAK